MKTDNGGGGSRTTWTGKPARVGEPGGEPINPTTETKDRQETIEVVRQNWRAEVETAQVYRELAEREQDAKRKGILLRMAEAEERHAQRWEKKLVDLGEAVPTLPDTIGRRLKRWLNRALGTEIAIRRMEAAEEKHEAQFRDQRDRALAGEHDVKDFLRESALEEKAHARALARALCSTRS